MAVDSKEGLVGLDRDPRGLRGAPDITWGLPITGTIRTGALGRTVHTLLDTWLSFEFILRRHL